MSGQRHCTFIKVFNHASLKEFPMLLGLVRYEYVAFWVGHLETGKFYREGKDACFYRDTNQKDSIVGQVTITEEMVKRAEIQLRADGNGVIKFKHISIQFTKP
jgi:hypothetical protein